MKSRLKVLFFIAMILNLSTEISGARVSEIAKANVKQAVMEKIGRGEKVNQGHINELADLGFAKLEGKLFEHLLAEGLSVEKAEDMMNVMNLSPYGASYNEARLHGSHDLELHKELINYEIEKKQLAGKKITQRHFNELAEQETAKVRNREFANLLEDGYPSELAMRLVWERGLVGQGEVYDKLRKPHINLRTGSALPIDLTIRKRIITREMKAKKRDGEEVRQRDMDEWARQQAGLLRNRLYHKMLDAGLDYGTAYALLNDRIVNGWDGIYRELRKPPIPAEEQVPSKQKKRLQPGEGSSSGSGHESDGIRSASND